MVSISKGSNICLKITLTVFKIVNIFDFWQNSRWRPDRIWKINFFFHKGIISSVCSTLRVQNLFGIVPSLMVFQDNHHFLGKNKMMARILKKLRRYKASVE